MNTQIEVFENAADTEDGTADSVGIVIRSAAILDYEGDLTPGCALTPWDARCLASALNEMADRVEGKK